MKNDCIFCKIVNHEIPAEIVYSDDKITAFKDVNPAAPIHLLIVPNQHYNNLHQCEEKDQALLGHILLTATKLAQKMGIGESGYRVLTNIGEDGRQSVFHLHFHVIGGQKLTTAGF